ncbi:MAG: pyruvate dehydrogenase (acetyl-transferring) E1 component subunit alpha [Gemmatimonadales bacterium]|nr:MAG: pyruvate dehydrogenase (acetyl-transferring) E1 component subunit alpha [Gemmatimonadales bacterium]
MAETAEQDQIMEPQEAPQVELDRYSKEELHRFLGEMLFYRRFEEKAEEAYAIGKIGGFCHLHIGQEAVALGMIGPLREDDYVITAYRDHTQGLAKGADPGAVMAELYGRDTGTSRGKGGSMHIFDVEKGFMGGHGIVGAQVPLAAGMGFAIRYREEDRVCVCFMGDAAVNQGAFHEALNMAAIWKLPVIFVVENNEYGMGTAFSRVSALPVVDRARGLGVRAHHVDAQDIVRTHAFMEDLVEEVRGGAGPQYVDARTYRFKGHSMSDPVSGTYRSTEEVESRKKEQDPIGVLRDRLMEAELLTEEELEELDKEARARAQEAADWAEEQPDPDPSELYTHVYAEENEHGRLYFDGRDREED